MKNRLLAAASAAVLSFTLTAGAVGAQELGMLQLQDNARQQFAQLGLDSAIIDSMTMEELSQVQAATSIEGSEQDKIKRVNVIVADAEERLAQGGAAAQGGEAAPQVAQGDASGGALDDITVIKETVRQNISRLGMTSEVDVDSLSDEQLMQIHLLGDEETSEDQQRQQIEQIVSGG